MKKLLIEMQYLGPVSYYALLASHKDTLIENMENFVKSTYRNRCVILTAAGGLMLSIPLEQGRDHHQPYREVKISYNEDWQRYHWKSIQSAYSNSPYFEFYQDYFQGLYQTKEPYLFEWNKKLMETVLQLLKLDTRIGYTTSYERAIESDMLDMRSSVHPSSLKDRTIGLVNILPYYQVFGDRNGFTSNVSIIDLLFNEGPAAKHLLGSYYDGLAD